MIFILALLFIICLAIFHKDRLIRHVKMFLWAFNIPGPLSIPPIGVAYKFVCDREEIFSRLRQIFKEFPQPLIRLWLGLKLVLVIREPRHLEKILQSTRMIEKDDIMDVSKPFIGEGLITGSGPQWKLQRKLIMPSLGVKAMEGYCGVFHHESSIMVDKFLKLYKTNSAKGIDTEVILEEYLHTCCIDIVCTTVLDTKLNAQTIIDHEFVEAIVMMYFILIERMVKIWLYVDFLFQFSSLAKVEKKTLKILRTFISDIIQKKKDSMQAMIVEKIIDSKTNGKKSKSLIEHDDSDHLDDTTNRELDNERTNTTIDQLVNAMYAGTLEITDEEMIDEVLTMFVASSDTIASIAAFTLKMLSMHPDYQENVVKEFQDKLKGGKILDSSSCSELVYLDRCVKEAIRLFPIAPFIVRKNKEDFHLDEKTTIPSGVTVMMALFETHRNPKYWSKPQEFYPDHFLPSEVEKRHPYAYLPFSSGMRSCVGKLYAMVSIKIIVTNVLKQFKLKCVANQPSVENMFLASDISVRAPGGNKVILTQRYT